jgi:acetaldehyde dehydrogenase/alcohol dehydrogenase
MTAVATEVPGAAHAQLMVLRARWATAAFASFEADRVRTIVEAVAEVAYQNAQRFAEDTVRETGMGIVEHQRLQNQACSRGVIARYGSDDYVSARIDVERELVEMPKANGVILALTPSTNPVAIAYLQILLALMTRNAVVVSPDPAARRTCADAVELLGAAAVAAGAPDGCVQVVAEPTTVLAEALVSDPGITLIVATGDTGRIRSADRSGTPARGIGPGNAPVFVDASADPATAAEALVYSKSFDNSLMFTSESTLIAEAPIADSLVAELGRRDATLLDPEQTDRIRAACFPGGRLQTDLIGQDAAVLARRAGITVPRQTTLLVAPFEVTVGEEPLAQEKPFPLLGMVTVPDARRGIDAARALLRGGGAGHSAVIHSRDRQTILAYGAALPVLRVTVNAPGSTGSWHPDTDLPLMTAIRPGGLGGASPTESLEPRHLVQWTRLAYAG